jgi:hypothetical protein
MRFENGAPGFRLRVGGRAESQTRELSAKPFCMSTNFDCTDKVLCFRQWSVSFLDKQAPKVLRTILRLGNVPGFENRETRGTHCFNLGWKACAAVDFGPTWVHIMGTPAPTFAPLRA